jgi:eukaryotic-like serine/threonine-protein kinase
MAWANLGWPGPYGHAAVIRRTKRPSPAPRLICRRHTRTLSAVSGVRPGDVIAGKFRIERVLGEGGMGFVVAARHLQLGQMVALKFMKDEVCTPEYKARFLREARNTVRLKSKHVSRVLDVGALDKGAPYMVMEYLEGTDLSDLLHANGPLPVSDACDYIIQACEAIAEAHGHGIVHRDLKPANLFLTKGAGGEPVVKVLDFGVSKVVELGIEEDDTSPGGRPRGRHPDSVVTRATDLLGSPSYMAPEQVVSARDADARSDVWSLGVILFRLISGKAPFTGSSLGELIQQIMHNPIPNLRDVKPDLPPGLEHVVARCLQRDRAQRLSDVIELARLLAPYAGPIATPSLERIAILGPALVTAAPQPAPSGPSFTGGNNAAWTTPPTAPISANSAAPLPGKPSAGMFAWLLAAFAMATLVFMVVRILSPKMQPRAAEPPVLSPSASVVVVPPPATTDNATTPPGGGTTSAVTSISSAKIPTASASTKPIPTPHGGHWRPPPKPTDHKPTPSAPAVDNIPATRE